MSRLAVWTEEEIVRLQALYPSQRDFEEIVNSFPERTVNAIRLKASRLGLRRPTIETNASTVLLCAESNGETKSYLLRCNNCGNWLQVKNGGRSSEAITCSHCGSSCYFVG